MNSMHTIIIVVQVLSALTIIGLVLLQHGKGADMGAAFGSGASGSLFGASGSSNFLSKLTGVAAAIFFAATLGLAFIGNPTPTAGVGVMENLPASSVPGDVSNEVPGATGAGKSSSDVPATKSENKPETNPANQIPK